MWGYKKPSLSVHNARSKGGLMIIAIAGQKGGTGKSTVAVSLAANLHERGHNVLLVDADPQGTAQTWADVAAEAEISGPTLVAMGANMHKPGQLQQLAENSEYTIVDCPGRDGKIQRAALLVADVALLPCGPSAPEGWAMAGSVEVVREAQIFNPGLRACAVITRKTRTVIGKQAREMLASLDLDVLSSELGFRVAYQEFLAAGVSLAAYARKDPASREIDALVDELLAYGEQQTADGDQTQRAVING